LIGLKRLLLILLKINVFNLKLYTILVYHAAESVKNSTLLYVKYDMLLTIKLRLKSPLEGP
jgi:hypothetical protein